MRTTDDEANTQDRPPLLARTIRGGFGGHTRDTIIIDAAGEVHRSGSDGRTMSATLTAEQLALVSSICSSSGFCDLPSFVDGPVSRSDSSTWTYQVGDHQVSMRDPERAQDAVPAALRTVDAVIEGVVAATRHSADAPSAAPDSRHTNVYTTGADVTDPAQEPA